MREICSIIEDLYNINKYLITIKGLDNNWVIYFYQNRHIKFEITTEISSTSKFININDVKDFIDKENNIKLIYITCYNDYKEYVESMTNLILEFKEYYKDINVNVKHDIGYL